ncbi:MAG: zinc ribbon domain-containing protein [Elusimicrobiaceae bacterium]|nr:zinc ribbon domain-containing protein [Elusimicrobiaceae bacterium]
MTDLNQPLLCPYCHLLITPEDNFCRHCGRSLKPGYGFFHSHTGIILMACLLGPLVLPWVWTSHRISRLAKIIYSVVLVLLGIYVAWSFYRAYQLAREMFDQVLNGLTLPIDIPTDIQI